MSETKVLATTPAHLHLMGICGVGMAGLAWLLKEAGYQVSGCDLQINHLVKWLNSSGINVSQGHSTAHLQGVDQLIISAAVDPQTAELAAAAAAGMPVLRRSTVLAELLSRQKMSVAVCGSHGKTTTTCFTARLFEEAGMQPGWCIGGTTATLQDLAGTGGSSGLLVVEADESDGSLSEYHPHITVLTNIDFDHMDHFADENALLQCFQQILAQTKTGIAVCRDCDLAWECLKNSGSSVPCLSYGFNPAAELRASQLELSANSAEFDLTYQGNLSVRVRLGVTGKHNVLNALGGLAAGLLLGKKIDELVPLLPVACSELPGRRFESLVKRDGAQFFSDYAHHPVEIAAAVSMAAAQKPQRLIVVFQPHRFTRTQALGPDFPPAFVGADLVILLPVFAASERAMPGGRSCDLYAHFLADSQWQNKVMLARDIEECLGFLHHQIVSGDLVLITGAGSIVALADAVQQESGVHSDNNKIARFEQELSSITEIAIKSHSSLARWSFYGTGGVAQWLVEVFSEQAVAAVISVCKYYGVPLRIVGMGANSWFSDLGYQGCVMRFGAGALQHFTVSRDEVVVGCGWRGPELLDKLQASGYAGLEFLEGVPGSLGGWLAMNAGAHGCEIADCVRWIRCLDQSGNNMVIQRDEADFVYRACRALQGRVAVECGLVLRQSTLEAVKNERARIRQLRIPLAGVRCAGSFFCNPPGEAAGRLLEVAGCKNHGIGGARVLQSHANIVVSDPGATSSDILALAMWSQARVYDKVGILLEPEVCGIAWDKE